MKAENSGDPRQPKASSGPAMAPRARAERRFIFLERLSVALADSGFDTIREQAAALRRLYILPANDNARALRLCDLMQVGRISPRDLLVMI